jgi:hypothetical protein
MIIGGGGRCTTGTGCPGCGWLMRTGGRVCSWIVQREEVVRIRVVEGTQSKASGVQRGGGLGSDMSLIFPP